MWAAGTAGATRRVRVAAQRALYALGIAQQPSTVCFDMHDDVVCGVTPLAADAWRGDATKATAFMVLLSARLMVRFGPIRLIPATFLISAVLFLGIWGLMRIDVRTAAVLLYLHLAAFGVVLISGLGRNDAYGSNPALGAVFGALNTMYTAVAARAREIATFTRFLSSRNSRPRGPASPGLAHMETTTTGASCPWNLSTVPTRAPSKPAVASAARIRSTWAL